MRIYLNMADIVETSSKRQTDWTKCCLCQLDKKEDIICPPISYKSEHDGYNNIAKNVPQFKAMNALPILLDPVRLDEGNGIEATLRRCKAKYHQNCRLKFNNTKLERARKREATSEASGESLTKVPRKKAKVSECLLCEKEEPVASLRQCMTMTINDKLNKCAQTLSDGMLLAKLSKGDVVALELKYHPACLVALYRRERTHLREEAQEDENVVHNHEIKAIAFSELVTYIYERKSIDAGTAPTIFKLINLTELYEQRLKQLGLNSNVHSTRLKEKLIAEIPEMESYKDGRDVLFAFHKDVGSVLGNTADYSEDTVLAKAAKIIRSRMLSHNSKFSGSLQAGCLESVPTTLLQFVCMIEHGADIKSQLEFGASKTAIAIAQLLQYNCHSRIQNTTGSHRHSKNRETPFPIYVGLSVFAKTRKKHLIEMLHAHGLCISYDRVMEISAQLGDAVITKYVDEGVVCPPVLKKGLFTTAAIDNIDHNPTSTTAQTSFHGTSTSIFQHPSSDNKGELRSPLQIKGDKIRTIPELPESFTNIPPAHFIEKNPRPPVICVSPDVSSTLTLFKPLLKHEYAWLEKVKLTYELNDSVNVTWSSYHASQNRHLDFEVSITSLMPLLRDEAHSVATVKHMMAKIKETVDFLNPGQVPVITADQPLYALAKQIQWHWPQFYGEEKFVIIFAGLHIEMAALRSVGTLLRGSGWTAALVESGVASPGTADSFLSVSSVTKARQAHQVTACSLYKLLTTAYEEYTIEETVEVSVDLLNLEDWCGMRKQQSPQFKFWYMVLMMELSIFTLIRSFREANFGLYCDALTELIPYFFSNNNVNYARWLSIHIRDMLALEKQHPDVLKEFCAGNFVVHKSNRRFSSMAIDQAHEQANAVIKGDGGAIGLTEDPTALKRWMIAGPEVSRLVQDYENSSNVNETNLSEHHDQTKNAQKVFVERVEKLTTVMQEFGNPFQEESADLLTLDTKDIAHPDNAALVATHYEKGASQCHAFMKALESDVQCTFYQPIKKNKIDFFRSEAHSSRSTKSTLKDNVNLFSQLFISCQRREYDLIEFFKHENVPFPPSLSNNGQLHETQKVKLTWILASKVNMPDLEPAANAIIIDGSALVNALVPRASKTFSHYAMQDVIPVVKAYATKYQRTDIVFDVYIPSSLKAEARAKRGQGTRRRVTDLTKTPKKWHNFLRDNTNKTELFNFLADKIVGIQTTNTIVVTKGHNAQSNRTMCLNNVSPCTHEEADTRIFVHAKDSVLNGNNVLMIKANDTDVVIIAVSCFPSLKELGLSKLWIAFGQRQNLKWIPVHEIFSVLGLEKTRGLLFFHAFSGCDVVSAFKGKGKKFAWDTWNVFDQATAVFSKLSQHPPVIQDTDMQTLEKYVVTMYDKSSDIVRVNELRLDLFARKQRAYESIPPTQDALLQHAKRAAFEAGCVWSQATVCRPQYLNPCDWGWTKFDEGWKVRWTTLQPIAKCCEQLTKCGCNTECHGKCKCYKFGLSCTALCRCVCQY